MPKLKSVTAGCGVLLVMVFAIATWLFGAEPQLFGPSDWWETDIQGFSYQQYMDNLTASQGDSLPVLVIGALAFPGAQLGRLLHNWLN